MRRIALYSVVALTLAAAAAEAQIKGDPKAGANKAGTCAGCHGIAGWRNAYPAYRVPKLGGQHAAYIAAALQAYKNGQRGHLGMQGIAASLTDQDIADLAAFLSVPDKDAGRPEKAASGSIEAGQRKSAPCQACHGPDGISPSDQFPRLASQYPDYLAQTLRQYKNGTRKNPIMAGFAQPLSDRDIADLSAFFAAQPNGLYMRPRVDLSPREERTELPAPDAGKGR
jgi:cytochrome c553